LTSGPTAPSPPVHRFVRGRCIAERFTTPNDQHDSTAGTNRQAFSGRSTCIMPSQSRQQGILDARRKRRNGCCRRDFVTNSFPTQGMNRSEWPSSKRRRSNKSFRDARHPPKRAIMAKGRLPNRIICDARRESQTANRSQQRSTNGSIPVAHPSAHQSSAWVVPRTIIIQKPIFDPGGYCTAWQEVARWMGSNFWGPDSGPGFWEG
jgi:hypothetical protein